MKYSPVSFAAAFFALCTSMFAQEPTMPVNGSKAMVFSFSGLANLNLNQFEGGIGGKYLLSDATVLRAGVQFAVAGEDIPANPPAGQTGTDGSVSATTIGISGALEYHLTRSRISPYIGGGLGFKTTSTESKNAVTGTTPQTTTKNDTGGESIDGNAYFGGSTISLFGILGLEYFIANGVSLAGEYRLGYSTTSRYDEEETSTNTTVTTPTGGTSLLGFSTSGALLLAVYF